MVAELNCPDCGAEPALRLLTESPGLLRRCPECGATEREPLDPDAGALRILLEVAEARTSLRRRIDPVHPFLILWLPPGDAEHRDEAVMIRDRLEADDPSVLVVTDPYPDSPEEPVALLAGLADFCLLSAPGPDEARAALRLLDSAVAGTRALVLYRGPDDEGLEHPRLQALGGRSLLDELTLVLRRVRGLAFRHALLSAGAETDPLAPDARQEALSDSIADDAAAYLLALLSGAGAVDRDRLLERAGGGGRLEARLDLLEAAGLVAPTLGHVWLTDAGRRWLEVSVPPSEEEAETEETALGRLFRNARSGDQEALGRILKTGGEEALRIARRRMGPVLRSKVDSIDISQSVMADLMSMIGEFEFRGEAAWRKYLRTLVENKIRAKADYFGAARRDPRREVRMDASPGDGPAGLDGGGTTPAEALLKAEEYERLEGALEQMPEAERDVLVRRIFEGMSHREIARLMGRPSENAVHKLYGRALARLAGILERG